MPSHESGAVSVGQRARELSIRAALDAQRRDVIRLVFIASVWLPGIMAALSIYLPAHRATKVDPMNALDVSDKTYGRKPPASPSNALADEMSGISFQVRTVEVRLEVC
jgi:hypothetical protein